MDLAGLKFIDSCGLAVLARVLKQTRGSGGDLPLAVPQREVRRVLEITGLIDVAVGRLICMITGGRGGAATRWL